MKRIGQQTARALALTAALAGGLLVGGWFTGDVNAQTAVRIFGTLSGAAKAIAVDSTGRLRVAIEEGGGTFTELVSIVIDGIGTTSETGLIVENTTAAAAGAQQYSPMLCQEGQGWKTDATAGSQSVEFCWEVQPVQGTSAPTANYILKRSINGGAFSTVGTFTSAGNFTSGSTITSGAAIISASEVRASAVSNFNWAGRSRLFSTIDGNVRVTDTNSINTYDITLADWGTTNSAESVSVANDAVLAGPSSGSGFLVVTIGTDNNVCTFALTGTNAPVEINDPGTLCSVTATTASSINVYYSSGYQIENKRGGTRALRIQLIGG